MTAQEFNKAFYWLRDRTGWPEHPQDIEERIESEFKDLIETFSLNLSFRSLDRGGGYACNYLVFVCFPRGTRNYQAEAIEVYISICAPVAAYGQVYLDMTSGEWGTHYSNSLLKPESVGIVSDQGLLNIENEIRAILKKFNYEIIDNKIATKLLPIELENYLKTVDSNPRSNQYFHGIFQNLDF